MNTTTDVGGRVIIPKRLRDLAGLTPGCSLRVSCILRLVAEWHEPHEATKKGYRARLHRGEKAVIPVHALLECYSVFTRLPPPLRTPPESAAEVLTKYFAGADLIGLPADAGWPLILSASSLRIAGGRVYDAAIAMAAVEAGATAVITWNTKRFLGLPFASLLVTQP